MIGKVSEKWSVVAVAFCFCLFAGVILLAAIPLCLMLKPSPHHLKEEEKMEEQFEAEMLAD